MKPKNPRPATAATTPAPPPSGYEDYAGEIQVANGKPPAWMKYLPYAAAVLGLGYYAYVRATDPVNLIVQVRFTTPKPPVEKETFMDILARYAPYIGAAVAVAVVLGVVWYLHDRKRRRDEQDDLLAYQAYVAAHKQEREAGRAPPV